MGGKRKTVETERHMGGGMLSHCQCVQLGATAIPGVNRKARRTRGGAQTGLFLTPLTSAHAPH